MQSVFRVESQYNPGLVFETTDHNVRIEAAEKVPREHFEDTLVRTAR